MFIYHYYMIKLEGGQITTMDGLVERSQKFIEITGYEKLKEDICDEAGFDVDGWALASLSYLGKKKQPS